MILGLDASTSICGWCALDDAGVFKSAGHIAFAKDDDLYRKLLQFRVVFAKICQEYPISDVYLEAPALMFASKSTAHVMSLLQRWNGMVSAVVALDWRQTGPILLSASTARATVGLKIKRGQSKQTAKDIVVEHIQRNELAPSSIWEYKRTGRLKNHCYDIADALVIARAGFIRGTERHLTGSVGPRHSTGK